MVTLALAVAESFSALAEPAQLSPRPKRTTRTVRVGYFLFPGFHDRDAKGGLSGYGYEFLQELRNYTDWKYEYSPPDKAWPDMFDLLREKKIDLLPGVSKTPEREAEFAFSLYPIARAATILTVKSGNPRYLIGDYKNWNGIRIGLLTNSMQNVSFIRLARRKGFSFQPVWFETVDDLTNALKEGKRIDAAVTSSLRKIGVDEWLYEKFDMSYRYIALRKEDTALREELDRTMERLELLMPELQEKLRQRYYTLTESEILAFNVQEKKFLEDIHASGRVFTCALNPDRKPFSWIENGEFHGIFKDYADEIFSRAKVPVRFIPFQTREEYHEKRRLQEVDIVFDLILNLQKAEEYGIRMTQPYFSVSVSMLHDKNSRNSLKRISVLEPGDLNERIRALLPADVTVRPCRSIQALLDDVRSEASDSAYLYTRSAEYAVFADEHNQLVSTYVPSLESSFSIGVKDALDPMLLSVLNKGVLSLDETFSNKIRRKYTPSFKEVFSLSMFFHRYPLLAVGMPIVVLLLCCATFIIILSRRKKMFQTGVMFSQLPLRCFVMNEQGEILYYTLGQRSKLSSLSELHNLEDIPEEPARAIMREKLASVLKTGKSESVEFVFDGKYRSAMLVKLPDSAFGANTALWVSQDITELQASRDEMRRHEEFFRLTLESIGDGAITTDETGRILLLNPVAERLTGVSCSEAQGKKHEEVFRIVSAIDGKVVRSPLRTALETEKIIELGNHTDLLSANGNRYHIADCAGPIRDRKGGIIGAVLIFRDVTAEYSRREMLRESAANWDSAVKLAKLQPYRVNIRTQEVLKGIERLNLYWPVTNGKVLPIKDWVSAEDQERVQTAYEELKNGKERELDVIFHTERNGESRDFRWFGHLNAEHPEIMSGLIQDITDIQKIKSERNIARDLWSQAISTAPLLMFIKSANNDFRYLQCNQKFSSFVGRPAEQIIGMTDADLFPRSQDVDKFREWDRKIMENGKPQEFFETALGANGKMFYFQTVKMPFRDADGNSLLIGMGVNITEIVEQRERLKDFNDQLKIGTRLVRCGTFRLNPRTLEITGTEMLRELCPVQGGKLRPLSDWVLPEDRSLVTQWLETMTEEKQNTPQSISLRSDWFGTRRYYRMAIQSQKDKSGDVWLTGAIQDVSELVRAAEKLHETSLMWKSIMDELPILFFVKEVGEDYRYIMCNKANAKFLGRPEEEIIGKTTQEVCQRGAVLDYYINAEMKIVQEKSINRTRINIPDAAGKTLEMEKIEMFSPQKDGKNLLIGVAFDITEREQNLRLANLSAKILSGIVGEADFLKVLDTTGNSAISFLGCNGVIFAKYRKDHRLHFLHQCGNKQASLSIDGSDSLQEKIWNSYADDLKKNELVCCNRLGAVPRLASFCKEHPQYANIAVAMAPVIEQGELNCVTIIVFSTPHSFSQIERRMLRAVSDCIVIATNRDEQNVELENTKKERMQQLEDQTAINACLKVFISSDYMKVPFEEILEIIRIRLGASYCFVLQIDREKQEDICFAETSCVKDKKFSDEKRMRIFAPASTVYADVQKKEILFWTDLSSSDAQKSFDEHWCKTAEERGFRSLWIASLNPSGVIWGSLGVVYDASSPKTFSAKDETFIRSAAHLVSLILMRSLSRDALIKTRDQLTVALRQAQSAEKAKSYFLASMSHEIRTPLNAVIGFTELMKDSAMTADTRQECLENIYVSGNALLQLINDILDLSKLEADQMQICPEKTDFPKFCNEVCRPFQYNASHKMLNLLVCVSEEIPPLMIDQMRIRQILFNLVGNAIKFTRQGSVRVIAKFTFVSTTQGSLMLQVMDTGIGIREEDQKKMFEPFVQLSRMRGTNASNSGTGLGLVIVRKLVERMGGTLMMESKEGEGTTFSILFPKVKVADTNGEGTAEIENVTPSAPQKEAVAVPASKADSSNQQQFHVLVVDDVPMNIKILSTMLTRLGCSFEHAFSGREGLEKMKTGTPFDWVLVDLIMPEMTGVEMAKTIRENASCNGVRIAAITAELDALPYDKKIFDEILLKPVSIPQLRKCLFRSENK